MLYQALLSLTGTGGIKDLKRETCNSEANTNATYLPSDCRGLVKKEFQQSLIVFSCEPDGGTLHCTEGRWLGLQTHQEAFALTHDTWHSNQTSSAHRLCKGISLAFGEGKKKDPFGLELSLRFTKAYRNWPINVSIREVAAWPLGCSSWFIPTWQLWARVVASVQTAVALKRLEASKDSEWYYDNLTLFIMVLNIWLVFLKA